MLIVFNILHDFCSLAECNATVRERRAAQGDVLHVHSKCCIFQCCRIQSWSDVHRPECFACVALDSGLWNAQLFLTWIQDRVRLVNYETSYLVDDLQCPPTPSNIRAFLPKQHWTCYDNDPAFQSTIRLPWKRERIHLGLPIFIWNSWDKDAPEHDTVKPWEGWMRGGFWNSRHVGHQASGRSTVFSKSKKSPSILSVSISVCIH